MGIACVQHLDPVTRLTAGRGEHRLGRVGKAHAADAIGMDGGTTLHGLARARHVPDVNVRADGRGHQKAVLQTPIGRGEWTYPAVEAKDGLKERGTLKA